MMPYMCEKDLSRDILQQILEATFRIKRRFAPVNQPEDFLATDDGLDRLDAICMMLIAIGESLKHLDKVTESRLLSRYPDVDWKGAMGIRDVLSHHYFDLDAELVFGICQEEIPTLSSTLQKMIKDLEKEENQ